MYVFNLNKLCQYFYMNCRVDGYKYAQFGWHTTGCST
jgi:hypothetical protein